MIRYLCRTLKRRMFRRDISAVADMGRRYLHALARVERLLPDDPGAQRLRDEYEKAEKAMLGK